MVLLWNDHWKEAINGLIASYFVLIRPGQLGILARGLSSIR